MFILRSRPVVLSIGMQQMKQDMRYRVKVHTLSKSRNGAGLGSGSHSGSPDDPLVFESDHHHHHHHHDNNDEQVRINDMVKRDNGSTEWGPPTPAVTTTTVDPRDDYIIQNWQFEIRKLTFDDAGTYQCLLPLVKPISKNITLQVIRKSYDILKKK